MKFCNIDLNCIYCISHMGHAVLQLVGAHGAAVGWGTRCCSWLGHAVLQLVGAPCAAIGWGTLCCSWLGHAVLQLVGACGVVFGWGTRCCSRLGYCATNWKVMGSIPEVSLEFFIDIILLTSLWPWV